MTPQRIGSLAPLPGGNANYLSTLIHMLAWIDKQEIVSRRDFTDWVATSYTVARSSVNNYVQTLFRLEVVEKAASGGYMQVSARGKTFLSAQTSETQAGVLLEVLAPSYAALVDILRLFADTAEPVALDDLHHTLLDRYPAWHSGFALAERVYWLLSLGCIQQIGNRRVYAITAFGRTIAENHRDTNQSTASRPQSEAARLSAELRRAAFDGEHPRALETATAAALKYLGYQVEHYGQAGTTDILGRALLGPASYSFILDTKARSNGVLHTIEAYTLHEHRQKHQVDAVVILAADFGGEKIQRLAQSERISLWTVDMLCAWLTAHEQMPQALSAYRDCFTHYGVLDALPETIQQAILAQHRRADLIHKLIDLMRESYRHEVRFAWSAAVLHSHLAMRYPEQQFAADEVVSVLDLLAHPAIGCVQNEGDTFIVGMDSPTLVRRLQRLADLLVASTDLSKTEA